MIELVLTLALVGVILWLITTKLPIDSTIKVVIQIVVVVCVIIWLMRVFGIADIPVPRVH